MIKTVETVKIDVKPELKGGVTGAADEVNKQLKAVENKGLLHELSVKFKAQMSEDPAGFFGPIVQSMKGGAESFVNTLMGKVGQAFGPWGSLIAGIFQLLNQSQEQFKNMIFGLAENVPKMITNIIRNAITMLSSEHIDAILKGLIRELPNIVRALVHLLINAAASPDLWVRVAVSAAAAFVKSIPDIVQALIDGIKDALKDIGKNISKGISSGGGFLSTVGDTVEKGRRKVKKFFGGHDGGMLKQVPMGFPNDSFPAFWESGELLIDRKTTNRLKKFLDNQGGARQEVVISFADEAFKLIETKLIERKRLGISTL
jgi:hypothetical protein